MKKANVIGRIDLSKVIKVKNTTDRNVSEMVANAATTLRRERVATIDMADKYVKLHGGQRKMGLKLLSHLDTLKKAGYAVLNPA